VRASAKFFSVAVRGGGGPVLVLPFSAIGKLPHGYPTINGHSAAVYDTAWSPFNDNMLATGSDDTTVKIWSIPDGGLTETMKDPVTTLSGHGKPVSLLSWHPTAEGVLASAGKDPSVRVWDVAAGVTKVTLEGFGGLVQDTAWSGTGALLATSDKAKVAKIWDPRTAGVTAEWTPHDGGKAFKLLFLGSSPNMLTVGFTKQSKREFKVWDGRVLGSPSAKPLATYELDQAAGVMIPFYDEDTRMLYLTGKGDGNIRYFELVDEEPFVHFLAEHRTNVSTKGADMLPKRALNVMKCEVARMLKLTGDSVEPLSFIVPRKSEAFQDDIFPDTNAGVPSLSAAEWFAGRTAEPKKVSLDPSRAGTISGGGSASYTPAAAAAARPAGAGSSPTRAAAAAPAAAAASSASSSNAALEARIAELTKSLAAANARISDLEAREEKLKKVVASLTN